MNPMQPDARHAPAIRRWLLACLALIALMVCVGGITRLTESGLSIVKWDLLAGTLPPMSHDAWQSEFDAYKLTPQFTKVNAHFTLADFQRIFWLEYLHRLLGRVIGLAVFLPLLYFAIRRALPAPLLRRMVAITLLVGAQGTVGWIMVASGLVDQPRVAPVKLALHLGLALAVFALLLWTYWQTQGHPRPDPAARRIGIGARALLLLVAGQIMLGALVAGLRAGYFFNTYPLMNGQWVPADLWMLAPWWHNHLENVVMVQFQHRMGAIAVALATVALVVYGWRRAPHLRRSLRLLAYAVALQFTLGVATLLSLMHIGLASAHQLAALLLLCVLLRVIYLTPLDANQHATKNMG